jgi:hypothetical protein
MKTNIAFKLHLKAMIKFSRTADAKCAVESADKNGPLSLLDTLRFTLLGELGDAKKNE